MSDFIKDRKRFKKGDSVKVVGRRVTGMNSKGAMDVYFNRTLTIDKVLYDRHTDNDDYGIVTVYKVKEDGGTFKWLDHMFV